MTWFVEVGYTLAAGDANTLEERVMKLINGSRRLSTHKGRGLLVATMMIFTGLTCLSSALSLQVRSPQGQAPAASRSVIGEWTLLTGDDKSQDTGDDLAISVVFSVEGDSLKGTALIPKVFNGTVAGTTKLALIDVSFDGQLLSFKIKDQGVFVAELKPSGDAFVGQYRIENSDEKGPLKMTKKK